jgi:hypothetical protein
MARVELLQPVLSGLFQLFKSTCVLSSQHFIFKNLPEDPPVSAPRNWFDTPWGPGFGLDSILDSWFLPKKKKTTNFSDFCLQLDLLLYLSTHGPKLIYEIISIVQPDL